MVGKTKLAALCSVFAGIPIGGIIASAVEFRVYGTALEFGSAAVFDAVILAAVTAVAIEEAVSAIKRMNSARAKANAAAMTEAAEEFDENEYKKYFDE